MMEQQGQSSQNLNKTSVNTGSSSTSMQQQAKAALNQQE